MTIFKIRMTAENHDDFIREFEVKAGASFKSTHDFFIKNLKLDSRELASFFISDDNWNKLQEITLVDMMAAGDAFGKEEKLKPAYKLMDKVRLDQYISQVDDKMIYVYDFLQMHTFLLEVIDVINTESPPATPKFTYSHGQFQTNENLKIENDPELLKKQLLEEFNLLAGDDDDDDDDSGTWNDDD